MSLALNLGKTVGELEREMTGVEFDLWQKYAHRNALPWRRIELHLAQIALKIVQIMGGNSDVVLADYLFDPPDEDEAEDSSVDEAAAFFNFRPRNA